MGQGQRSEADSIGVGPRYRVLRQLGEGSFGAVYEAFDEASGRSVALKALRRLEGRSLAQFKREFRLLSGLNHANLVELRELYEHEGTWLIVMELIEGADLLSWVRSGEGIPEAGPIGFDEARLRTAFAGAARGLAALHEHGLLHRDVKASNILVSSEGRAVVLDFGLVTDAGEEEEGTHGDISGTVAYMAPEQAAGKALGPAADFYALGVCLYQALTGQQPFEAPSPFALLVQKNLHDAPSPRGVCPAIPRDLEELCISLLAREPSQRPGPERILQLLGDGYGSTPRTPSGPLTKSQANDGGAQLFEGRAAELLSLREALACTRHGELRLAIVEGDSGVGKSALLQTLARKQQVDEPSTWVLRGRCYEHERVPYKALDGCVDALAKALSALPERVCSALLPRGAGLLAELFPVLRTVPAMLRASMPTLSAEPTARRLAAFRVLGELLGKLAETYPLLLVIDDLQWADEESFRLLRGLFEQRPALLLTCTVRPLSELSDGPRRAIEQLAAACPTLWLRLHGLDTLAAARLTSRLLEAKPDHATVMRIVSESDGHPMLIEELVRYARGNTAVPAQALTLGAALGARVAALSSGARALLESLAVSSRPHPERLYRGLLAEGVFPDALKELLRERLARRNAALDIAPAHDRIRRAVVELIPAARLSALHRAIAEQLARAGLGEPSELARHFEHAEAPDQAGLAWQQAAQHALEVLAFANAAEHGARALLLLGAAHAARREQLLKLRGDALSALGKSSEAAEQYGAAAELASGEARLKLRIDLALQLLKSAQLERGKAVARELLAEHGVNLPTSTPAALAYIVWQAVARPTRSQMFAKAWQSATDHPADPSLEVMLQLVSPLHMLDPLTGLVLGSMYRRRALSAGPREHVARSAALACISVALIKSLEQAVPMFELSRKLCGQYPSTVAFARYTEGSARLMLWELAGASECLEAAYDAVLAERASDPWLVTLIRRSLGSTWRLTGAFQRLASASESWIAEAEERGDRYAMGELIGLGAGHVRHLMRNDPEAALAELEQVMQVVPQQPFAYVHLGHLVGMLSSLLCTEPQRALTWLEPRLRGYRREFLFKTRFGREILLHFEIAAALRAVEGAAASERSRVLARARAGSRKLRRIGSLYATIHADLSAAQIDALDGKLEPALASAQRAAALSAKLGYVDSHSATYLAGMIEGGSEGAAKREAELAWFRSRGFRDPLVAMFLAVPALRALP